MILRTKFTDGYEVNTDLGNEYHWIDKESCANKFSETAKVHFGENISNFINETYGFIIYGKGSEVIPLYKEQRNYILNNEGGLFKDLTYK